MNELLNCLTPTTLAQVCADIMEITPLSNSAKLQAIAMGENLVGKDDFAKMVEETA